MVTKRKELPAEITSYDLLKTFAVLIMIIDHLGHYFFPEMLWFRSIGRIGFPVWFFLVGYSSGRDIPKKLWMSACLLELVDLLCGGGLFSLNALFTIIWIRLVIDPVMKFSLKAWPFTIGTFVVLLSMIPLSYVLTEYGTQALITAMFGYAIRHRDKINNNNIVTFYLLTALISFVITQQILFSFSQEAFLFMAIGTLCVRCILCFFKPQTYPMLRQKIPAFGVFLIQLSGRRTLEIYVVHLILFKILALALGSPDYQLFDLYLFNIE